MFTAAGLFKQIPCPNYDACRLPNCMFNHDLVIAKGKIPVLPEPHPTTEGRENKRRKLENGTKQSSQSRTANGSNPPTEPVQKVFVGSLTESKAPAKAVNASDESHVSAAKHTPGDINTIKRGISPPPLKKAKVEPKKQQAHEPEESLLKPRKLDKNPTDFATRTLYIKKIHEGIARLNTEVAKSNDQEIKALHLSDNRAKALALDEEADVAKANPTVYANVVKLRIVKYKKMTVAEWIKFLQERNQKLEELRLGVKAQKPAKPIVTGLLPKEEGVVLEKLLTPIVGYEKYGYVVSPPTDGEIQAAIAGVQSSLNYEKCDRCSSRFQVFPERRNTDGALTTGGPCTHHPGRVYRPPKEKTDTIKGFKEPYYDCCAQPLGTPGCTIASTHVFKISEAKRLASIMQFEVTPPGAGAKANGHRAIAFDCEMGYTVYGLELIRLTATSWPSGDTVLDVLVRPLGAILDLNSRFSGVFPEHYTSALPWDPSTTSIPPVPPQATSSTTPSTILSLVPSPYAARRLLMDFLTPHTPLIGHALENDLNSVRLCHPAIIDTVLLFPHPRGLPIRYGLKALVKKHLDRDIQMAGARGHDSGEDARAAGWLVQWQLGREWARLKKEGWVIRDGVLCPPSPVDGVKAEMSVGAKRSIEEVESPGR